MKNILIVLLVVALLLLIVGAANNDQRVDVDYLFGTWYNVSLFSLIAIAVASLVVVGLLAAAFAGIGAAGQRRRLERELEQTYGRLREAEARVAQMTDEAAAATRAATPGTSDVPAQADDAVPGLGDLADSNAVEVVDEAGSDDRTRALGSQPGRDDV